MKKKLCVLLALWLLLSAGSGCAGGQDELYSKVMDGNAGSSAAEGSRPLSSAPEPGEANPVENRFDRSVNYLAELPNGKTLFEIAPRTELSGTLTISTAISSQALLHWIEAFEAAYPNVEVVLNAGFDSYAAVLQAEEAGGGLGGVEDQMVVDLFAGEAGDIVNLNTAPYQRYAQSGLFRDFYSFMENDPDFHQEDYYTNVFKGWETADGQLPVLGPSVFPTSLIFNKLVLDEMGVDLKKEYPEGLNYQEVAELYHKAKEAGAMPEDAVLGQSVGANSFDPFETVNYFEERNLESRFDDPGYVKYLETMKEMTDGMSGVKASFEPFTDRSELLHVGNILFSQLDELEGKWDGVNKVYQTYRLQNGSALFRGTEIYGITASCEHPELAWEFIKFMVSGKEFPEKLELFGEYDRTYRELYSDVLPVCRGNLKKLCDSYYGDEKVYQAADDMMQTLGVQEFREGELFSALFDIYRNYYEYDLIDAKECAKQLQERAWIYLNE